MADPRERKAKRLYMKIFFGDKELYKEFLELYDNAVSNDSVDPESAAMVHFRDRYLDTDDGWVEKA